MTRKEFLTALDQYLVTMSASEKADIISDYEEHFRVGLENGKTEAEIAASLGSPYDVANQFLDGRKPKAPAASPSYTGQQTARPATSPSYTGQQTARPAASPSYTGQQTARPAASQPYTGQQTARPAASQPYAGQQTARPAASSTYAGQQTARPAASQPYTGQQTGYPAAAPQGYAGQQPVRPAAASQGYEVYDVGIADYPKPAQQELSQRYAGQGYATNPSQNSGYVDYDRAAAERRNDPSQTKESKYNSTGLIMLIVLCVVLIPTVGGTIVSLLVGLYGAVVGFASAGGSLIAVGTAFSAQNIWICLGMIFIGISFLALTGLLIMASIEGTKLFVKLIKYCIKEGKKLVTEGSF